MDKEILIRLVFTVIVVVLLTFLRNISLRLIQKKDYPGKYQTDFPDCNTARTSLYMADSDKRFCTFYDCHGCCHCTGH